MLSQYLLAAVDVPRQGLRDARLAVCDLVEGRYEESRQAFRKAIQAEPSLFEARYGLAVLEQDDGHAGAAFEEATAALGNTPNDVARAATQAVAASVRRFAR